AIWDSGFRQSVRFGGGSSAWGDAMAKPRDNRQRDLLRPALEEIVDLGHPLVRLAREIDWGFLDSRFAGVCASGAGQPPLPTRVVVDTTVQPKAMAHPSDARLCHRALQKLVDLAERTGVRLRQSYRRVAKRAAIMVGRYTHAHQFNRARRELKFLRIRLGRVIRDIRRKIGDNETLRERFAHLLALAVRVRFQDHRQRGPKVYSLHAPEVECIGKGKARAPYEFGCKVSIATPATKP